MDTLLPIEKVKRETIIKIPNATTSPKYGQDPNLRPVEQLIEYGIINLDKPAGPTSHQVSYYAQKVLGLKKSGHSGTLDPNVTGILPIATGKATRVVQALLIEGKEYIGVMHLHKTVDEKRLREVVTNFTGKIKQLPPVRSNVKRAVRYRRVYYFEILEINGSDILFKVGTQAGTYIRKLCHDIGQALGCGAQMWELRRTKVGHFNELDCVTLQDLADAYWLWKNEGNDKFIRHCIKPIEVGVFHLPKIVVLDTAVDALCHGAHLAIPGIVKFETGFEKDALVAMMTQKGEFIAFGKALLTGADIEKNKKGLAVKIESVFMNVGTYPKIEKIESK